MNKIDRRLIALISALILVVFFVVNQFYKRNDMITAHDFPAEISVDFAKRGEDWALHYGKIVNANTKNFGLNFYDITPITHKKSMTVKFKTGELITKVPNALSVNITEDRDRNGKIITLHISAEINKEEYVSHEVAHQYVWDLIQSFRKVGWVYAISVADPRLQGKHAFDYYKTDNIDPDYLISFAEWMALPAPFIWELYADHTYMSVRVDRDVNHLDPNKPGAYFIRVDIIPQEVIERREVEVADRDHWRDSWIQRSLKYRASRNKKEAALKAKGIPINADYKDPPLPPPPAGQKNPVLL